MAGFANDVVYANNGDFSVAGSNKGSIANGLLVNGQMWIGTTNVNAGGTHINVGTISSPDASLTIAYSSPNITLQVTGGTTVGKTITGNSGGAISPVAGNWNILTSNSTFKFAGTAGTETLSFNNTNPAIGSSLPALTTGVSNVIYGNSNTGKAITSGNQNVIFGTDSGSKLTTASDNIFIGDSVGNNAVGSSQNVAIGSSTLAGMTTGSSTDGNIAIGYSSLGNLVSGTRNIVIGYNVGNNYNGSESSNILIGNTGLITENNVIKIGTSGSSQQQQNKTFIAAITGTTVAASSPVGVDTNGQLSDLDFGTATQVLTSNGAGVSPSWQPALGFSPVNFSFRLSGNISNVTGDGTDYAIKFDTTTFNVGGGSYDGSTGEYTFPQLGKYLITVTNFIFGGGVADTVFLGSLVVNGSTTFRLMDANPGTLGLIANGEFMQSATFLYEVTGIRAMAVHVAVNGGTKNVGVAGGTQSCIFSGFRVA